MDYLEVCAVDRLGAAKCQTSRERYCSRCTAGYRDPLLDDEFQWQQRAIVLGEL
jgi:hypothetical protein